MRWMVGDIEVVRVDDPGFELVLPQEEPIATTLAASPGCGPTSSPRTSPS